MLALFKDRKVLQEFKAPWDLPGPLVLPVLKDRAVLQDPRDRKD
jgi:hypothetical protein